MPHVARGFRAFVLHAGSLWVSRSYCHRVIQLSDAVLKYPKSVTCNIHGVRSNFIAIGAHKIGKSIFGGAKFSKGAYFIGKAVWAKGHRQLQLMLREHLKRTGENLEIDIFGAGPDWDLIKAEIQQQGLNWNFLGPVDHADPKTHPYKVFINPSLSDVVCTTSAEALAMGKFVVCADHPSNEFFKTFRNCFVYRCMRKRMLACVRAYVCACIRTHVMHTCTHSYLHVPVRPSIDTYTHIYLATPRSSVFACNMPWQPTQRH